MFTRTLKFQFKSWSNSLFTRLSSVFRILATLAANRMRSDPRCGVLKNMTLIVHRFICFQWEYIVCSDKQRAFFVIKPSRLCTRRTIFDGASGTISNQYCNVRSYIQRSHLQTVQLQAPQVKLKHDHGGCSVIQDLGTLWRLHCIQTSLFVRSAHLCLKDGLVSISSTLSSVKYYTNHQLGREQIWYQLRVQQGCEEPVGHSFSHWEIAVCTSLVGGWSLHLSQNSESYDFHLCLVLGWMELFPWSKAAYKLRRYCCDIWLLSAW